MQSFRHAGAGFAHALRSERNMRIHIAAAAGAAVFAWLLDFSRLDWLVLLIAISIVVTAELLNTAIERMVDLVSPNFHPLAKAAKDIAAAAVGFAALTAVIIGIFLYYPYVAGKLMM